MYCFMLSPFVSEFISVLELKALRVTANIGGLTPIQLSSMAIAIVHNEDDHHHQPATGISPYITYHTLYYWYILINLHCIWLHCVTYCDYMMPFNKVVHLEKDCWFAHFDMPVVLRILTHLPICANWHVRYVVLTIPYATVTLTWGPCIVQIVIYVILRKMACVCIPPLSTCSIDTLQSNRAISSF